MEQSRNGLQEEKEQNEKVEINQEQKWKNQIEKYQSYLVQEERSVHTIQKYSLDVRRFLKYKKEINLTKELVLQYKLILMQTYKITSVNSMLASINSFFQFLKRPDCKVKSIRTQKKIFCKEKDILHRKEYERLLRQAQQEKKERLAMMIRAMGCTGIRISELQFLTVEAVNEGILRILNKGKYREILLPMRLQEKLLVFAKENNITEGLLFITKSGAPVDRSNLWRQLKLLAIRAQVSKDKVFPHNFRHMFARAYYQQEKDIVKLADILGHTSLTTTRIYIISTGAEHQRQLDELNLAG